MGNHWLGLTCPIGMKLVLSPAKKEVGPLGKIAPLCVDETEVTQEAYFAYARANGIAVDDRLTIRGKVDGNFIGGKKPMIFVSRDEADAYCRAQDKRLLTGAEWMRAARGPKRCEYATSACDSLTDKEDKPLANYRHDDLPGDSRDSVHGPMNVASFPPGPNGLFDMAGNVEEWVLDDGSSLGGSSEYVVCGGSWSSSSYSNGWDLRPGSCQIHRGNNGSTVGFRCGSSPGTPKKPPVTKKTTGHGAEK